MVHAFFKRLILLAYLIAITVSLQAQDVSTTAPSIKTFSLDQDLTGLASNSVNLHTGDVALPLNILSLTGHNGLDVGVSIGYSSNIQNSISTWNLESPAGILGLGWTMELPRITSDNKLTGTREDDEYYVVEGGVSNLLIRTASGSDADGVYYTYETKNYQFWKIRFYYDPVEVSNSGSPGPNKWVIIKDDGTIYTYGDKNSNRATIQWAVRWANWMGNSSQLVGQGQLASTWNLSEIKNVWNEKIIFEYENVEQFVGTSSGQKHTEASYLKKVTDVWGRKVVFFYNERQSEFYAEPHTEQAEPDAYQEVYEKKYLDHIDVLSETDVKFLSLHFTYTSVNSGTSYAKMLLTSIVQKNAQGSSLPGIQFEYYTAGSTKGFLKTVTYPTGGSVTYTYTANTIGHSNRQFTATAPAGYGEGRVWLGEDYVVLTWRQLGGGGSHDSGPREVKLYVYQWVGEWKEQFLQTIGSVSLEGDEWFLKDYKEFQVTLQKNFFAVYSNGTVFIRHKDPNNRGYWLAENSTHNYGEGMPTLVSGTNFIAVGSWKDDVNFPSHLYTFQGNSWKDDVLDQTKGDHAYTGSNNFFISHNRGGFTGFPPAFIPPEINFSYLTEDKKWVNRSWASALEFSANDPCHWFSSNSMAIAMADNNPEFAYRWDITYNNFYRDQTDKNGGELFGELDDNSPVYMVGNSLVGIYGRLARYDGKDWSTASITSQHNSIFGQFFSYGDDFVVRPAEDVFNSPDYRGGLKVFNPNTLQWQPDVILSGADQGRDFASAGQDYFYSGNGYWYRQTNGTWVKKITYGSYLGIVSKGSYPRVELLHGDNPHGVVEVRQFKNGEISAPYYALNGRNVLYVPYRYKSNGVGNQTIVTVSTLYPEPENANSYQLNRIINDDITGSQTDYPVTLVTTNDGTTTNYISLDYNFSTSVVDASGTVTQYNEVTEIPGSNTSANRPFGYTKSFFYNGLTYAELGVSYFPVDLLWSGLSYRKEVYDKNSVLVGSAGTAFQTYSRNILNDVGTKVFNSTYVRHTEERTMADNVETVTSHYYDINTGQVLQSTTQNSDSKNTSSIVYYKYFWEQYDVNRTKNILSPVIQTKKSIWRPSLGEVITDVAATTFKSWNNVFAPHKTYQWKRTGTSDFDFTSWSDAGEPGAHWIKVSEINGVDAAGNIKQITYR